MKSMEKQIGQLANALKDNSRGHFPSNTKVNPIEHCKVIEMRSGKRVGAESEKSEKTENSVEEKKVKSSEIETEIEKNVEEKKSEPKPKLMYKPQLPYPQRFKKQALDEQFTKFLEIFKKLHINISFADTLLQMSNYVKFLKEVMSRKRKLEEFETVNLTEECSAILQNKIPQKLKNPGRSLGLGEVKPTTIALQLADRSLTYPHMEEDKNMPLILGRLFLATADAKIDIKKGELTMGVDGEKVIFNVFKEVGTPSMEKVFMIKPAERMGSYRAEIFSAVKLQRGADLPVPIRRVCLEDEK
ncbi:uncharacterized protein [Henckelia pumila]|uniref:uncharacterized protein n=1 Tax=Henckelia pumila TaxID=405737 RepID=UPI003C6DF715